MIVDLFGLRTLTTLFLGFVQIDRLGEVSLLHFAGLRTEGS